MVIDAGWFPAEGCGGGPYDRGNENFPDMDRVASQMRSIDVRPGIWIRPLLTQEAPANWKLPATHPIHSLERGAVLDPSAPEVLELVKNDIARLREWGYSLIKHDFTTFDLTGRWGFEMGDRPTAGDWTFADSSRTTAEITRDLYAAIREAAGDAILIGCNTVGHLGAGLFELQRTGDDTSGREWERTRKMGVNTLAFRMPQHDAFFAVDADCVGLTNDVPWEMNRKWLDILARSGTPLFVSADPNALGADQTAALKEAFALAAKPRPVAKPMDWMETTCPERWEVDGETQAYKWTRVP
jgi:alpha-galactosidase